MKLFYVVPILCVIILLLKKEEVTPKNLDHTLHFVFGIAALINCK